MSNHNFSNQKSALENYFESLLEEDDSAKPHSAEAVIETKETIKSPVIDVEKEQTVENEVKAQQPIENQQAGMRTSVADMLADVEKMVVSEPEIATEFAEPVAEIVIPMPKVAEQTEVETEVVEEVVVEVEVEEAEVAVVEQQPEITQQQEIVKETTGTPEWAESKFQCLLFKVGELSLAVPLIKLNGVIPWSENVVETPNQTDWYLGVLMNHGNKVEVIDTAVMVLPAAHRQDMATDPADRLSHILLVDDQKWGLACDSIGEVVWLKKDDVKWRSNKTKRPWLLGTAIDHMCAVMDTEAFAEMLGHKK